MRHNRIGAVGPRIALRAYTMPRKILVVDDDHATRVGLVALLESEGYDVIAADNLKTARKAMSEDDPSLLITDVRLGEFNGLHLAAANRRKVPIIVITGYPDPVLEETAREFDAEFLLKPIKPSALLSLVERKLSEAAAHEGPFQPQRRWQRKRVTTELRARVDQVPVRVVDISYGGLGLAAHTPPGTSLPPELHITFPTASVSVTGQVVWERSNDASWTCGVMVADESQPQWHALVDATS
jgi:FixJ family two-component response regulator